MNNAPHYNNLALVVLQMADLHPYEKNPRNNDAAVDAVVESIKQCGYIAPIIVDEDGVILAGHTRYKALQKLGKTEVECIVKEGLTEEQKRKYRLLDNKTNELADWDMELLAVELADLDFGDLDLNWGLDLEEDRPEAIDDDYDKPAPEVPRAKPGDIWQLGRHRLMCGDSTKLEDVERLMGGMKADLVFTDPPYNVAFNGRSGKFEVIENDDLAPEEFDGFIAKVCDVIRSVNPANYYVWCNWKFYSTLQTKLDFKSCIVWAKNVFGLGTGYRHQHEFCLFNGAIDEDIKNESDLWEVAKDTNYVHPTQKPVGLCTRALTNHKAARNILDLFGGSGSTLIACEQLGRTCYIAEIDPRYVDVIIDRWEQFTGEEAVLISD
jgi:site-specific DNA-methyltransferase (adenine-specific)